MMIRATSSAHGSSAASAHSGIGAHDACRVLFRHMGKRIACFCTTLALVVLCGIVYPRTNMSDARSLVRLGTLPSLRVGEHVLTVPVRAVSILVRKSALIEACEPRCMANA